MIFVTVGSGSFNPRPPGGGRQLCPVQGKIPTEFQSTPPGWRATFSSCEYYIVFIVSIHAPRVEGDSTSTPTGTGETCFNPRPPGGGRPRNGI